MKAVLFPKCHDPVGVNGRWVFLGALSFEAAMDQVGVMRPLSMARIERVNVLVLVESVE